MYSALTYDVINFISHVCEIKKKKIVMAIFYWKQGLLCDKYKSRSDCTEPEYHLLLYPKCNDFLKNIY